MVRALSGAIAGVVFLVSGCVTSREIAVEVSSPPQVALPAGSSSLTLVIRVPDTIRKVRDHKMAFCKDPGQIQCLLAAGEKALLGFSERIFEESDLNVRGVVEWMDTAAEKGDTFEKPLTGKDITRLCTDKDHSDQLVSLEKVTLARQLDFSSYKMLPHEARNKVWSKTILYNVQPRWMQQAVMKIFIRNGWRIYDYDTKQIIFEDFVNDSVSYKVDGVSREEVEKKLPSLKTSAERAGFVAGWDFAGMILPSHKTVPRKYYGSRFGPLKEATREVMFRQWDEAERMWQEALKDASKRKKARILYNLALARERQGDYEKALDYIDEAMGSSSFPEVIRYKRILEREISKCKK